METSIEALLSRAASSVADPSAAQAEILDRLHALEARIEDGRLRVAVLEQFKRGKSS